VHGGGRVSGAGSVVTLVVLAEAHLALSSPLAHAHVVHHEHVDVQILGAATPYLPLGRFNSLDDFDAASVALFDRRQSRPIERIGAKRIDVTVAVETTQTVARCAFRHGLGVTEAKTGQD